MAADFRIERDAQSGQVKLQGTLDLYHAPQAGKALKNALQGTSRAIIDVSQLTRLDTVGALLLRQWRDNGAEIRGLRAEHAALFDVVAKASIEPPPVERRDPPMTRLMKRLGEKTCRAYSGSIELINFFGQACVTFSRVMFSPKHLRIPDIVHHIEETGIHAVPIIGLIAFLIAIVLAYQGVAQLRPLGGEQYTVNLVAISVLREMGVLLTAIMVAGRSGSAFTAEIGVMKVREEVDALQVIGIDPFEVLVMPRLIALVITLPLLTFLADMMGLLGGGLVSTLLINIPLPQYMERVRHIAHGHDFFAGMIKAPVFAFLIATVGCMHGMKVSGSAESVGRQTTSSVVKSIFLVLVADAIFSVLFERIGI